MCFHKDFFSSFSYGTYAQIMNYCNEVFFDKLGNNCHVRDRNLWCLDFIVSLATVLYKTRQIWGIWKLRPAYSPETPNLGQNRWCFVPCDLEIWWMTLENNRASFLCCFKLCETFHSHWWIQTGVTVRKRPNLGQIRRIWCMTLKNNRAPLLCYFKLYASFHSHRWIQAGVTVRKRPIWVKIDDFFSRVTLQFEVWPCKTIGHLFYATSSFVHHFVAIGDFKLELQSGNAQFGSNSMIFRAVWPCNLTYDLEKQ